MKLRIIAGKFGGLYLDSPHSRPTHPMSQLMRNAIFNSLSHYLDQAEVLDAFAGTGALGLEALSRGAKQITFIENNLKANRVLQQNIVKLGVKSETIVDKRSAYTWLEQNQDQNYDLIFLDPPYQLIKLRIVEQFLALLKPNGVLVFSHPSSVKTPVIDDYTLQSDRTYGNATISIYSNN